ncbi:26S protease regulatory subunit 4 -like protein [Capsicum baccatum]|uniref:26S protease regulatory subunit 4-like protein n=1 Tax=Capsicum baccatum TaxID=33114 RepID=A0A2G2VZK5_CAPBA|nr:26S protease regulatory subunit 4 -like protein [Capsicum baccatum]
MKVRKAPSKLYVDFGGLDVLIQEITEVVECPLTHPKLSEDVGIKHSTDIVLYVLYGKAEVGKTIAKVVAQPYNFSHLPAPKTAKDATVVFPFIPI